MEQRSSPRQRFRGRDLLFVRTNDVTELLREGKRLVIVAAVKNVLHFRAFDGEGNMIADVDESTLSPSMRECTDLVKARRFDNSWPLHQPTATERARVINAVESIILLNRCDGGYGIPRNKTHRSDGERSLSGFPPRSPAIGSPADKADADGGLAVRDMPPTIHLGKVIQTYVLLIVGTLLSGAVLITIIGSLLVLGLEVKMLGITIPVPEALFFTVLALGSALRLCVKAFDLYGDRWLKSGCAPAVDEGKGKATAGLVLGLISAATWMIPLLGLPAALLGLALGVGGLGPKLRGRALAAMALSLISIVLSALVIARYI
jgi:hypothetical protein